MPQAKTDPDTDGDRVRIVPDGCTSIDRTIGATQLSDCAFVGPSTTPRERTFEDETIIGVRLNPGTAHLLLKRPVHALLDRRGKLATLGVGTPDASAAETPDAHIAALEQWLIGRLAGACTDSIVARCVARIVTLKGRIEVETLARESRLSA